MHDSPDKLFIGGLPCDWTEEQVSGAEGQLRLQGGEPAGRELRICGFFFIFWLKQRAGYREGDAARGQQLGPRMAAWPCINRTVRLAARMEPAWKAQPSAAAEAPRLFLSSARLGPGMTPPPRVLLALQVKEMLLPYGALKAFNLVMDRSTGNSKVRGSPQLGRGRERASAPIIIGIL